MPDDQQNSSTGPAAGTGQPRGVSIRAVVIGFLLGSGLAAIGYFNDSALAMPALAMDYFPLAVYGGLILALLTVHPLMRWLMPRWSLRPGELAVVLCIVLGSASLSSRGLMRTFIPSLAAPAKHYTTNVTWRRYHLMEYVPKGVLVCDGKYDGENGVIDGYWHGLQTDAANPVGLGDIPWQAWKAPLLTWLPIICSVFLGALALALIVHPQWSKRELLKFPIAEFASTMIHGRIESAVQVGRAAPKAVHLLKRRGFWVVFAVAFGIHLINGFQLWYPTSIQIPMVLNTAWPILGKWPWLGRGGMAWFAYNGHIYLVVVGFSFFVTREVSLALGLTPMVHEIFMGVMIAYGMNPRAASDIGMYEGLFNIGVLMAIAWAILWAGRSYYLPLFARAVGLRRGSNARIEGVWAARVFLVACAAAVYFLTRIGLHWSFAIILVLAAMLIQMVIARINVETGLFFYRHLFEPHIVLAGVLGLCALGPRAHLLAGIFVVAVGLGSTMQVIPLVINGLEISRRQNVPTGRASLCTGAMMLVAIAIGTVSVLWISYTHGGVNMADNYGAESAAAIPFKNTAGMMDKLARRDELKESRSMSIGQRWANMSPPRSFLMLVAAGFALTFLVNLLRQRYSWWPLHPIVLAVWGSYPLGWLGFSFLIGWAIRTVIVKLFGERGAHRAKPMMIGLIAGEFAGISLWLIVGWIYYLNTGAHPKVYGLLPG